MIGCVTTGDPAVLCTEAPDGHRDPRTTGLQPLQGRQLRVRTLCPVCQSLI